MNESGDNLMPLTDQDYQEIIRRFDDRYVRIEKCNETQEGINKKFANDDKRIDMMLAEQKQLRFESKKGFKFNNWLTAAVLGAIIAAAIAYYFFS